MTSFATAITVLSCSLFAAAIIKILAPSGSTEKILKLTISLFVLICIVACFKSVADSVNLSKLKTLSDTEDMTELNATVDQNVLKVTGDYMAKYVESLLSAENLTAEKIEVTVEADENSVINLTDVSIYIDESDSLLKSKYTEIIQSDLNITPKVNIKEQ